MSKAKRKRHVFISKKVYKMSLSIVETVPVSDMARNRTPEYPGMRNELGIMASFVSETGSGNGKKNPLYSLITARYYFL